MGNLSNDQKGGFIQGGKKGFSWKIKIKKLKGELLIISIINFELRGWELNVTQGGHRK